VPRSQPDLRQLHQLRAVRDDNKFHGCQLLADAALRPASRMRSRSARAIGWSVYWRTLRRARMVSQVSTSQLYACTPAQAVPSPVMRAESRLAVGLRHLAALGGNLSRFSQI
jgi:hypothetical protein